MKGKLFIGLAFAALAAGGCFLAGNSTPRHQFTPDEIANIEALTQTEDEGNKCFQTYRIAPNDNSLALRIRKCFPCGEEVWVTSCSNSSKCK